MAKHPQHDLLIAAANDVDARFTYNNENSLDISHVLCTPSLYWKLVDKFAELKKAYAEGKTIQVKSLDTNWLDCSNPNWIAGAEYRIKPEPVYEWQWLVKSSDGYLSLTNYHYENAEQCKNAHHNSATILYRIEESKREVKSPLEVEE